MIKYLILLATVTPVFASDILKSITEYTEEISSQIEENENSKEGKNYKYHYQASLKLEKEKRRKERKHRMSCVTCPNDNSVLSLLFETVETNFTKNDYLYVTRKFKNIRYYNAIYFKDQRPSRLDRTYGENHYDTINFDPTIKGYIVLFENVEIKDPSVLDYYKDEKIIFYTSRSFFLKIHIHPRFSGKNHEISLYEKEDYTGIEDIQFIEEEFEFATNFNYKTSSQFFDNNLHIDTEVYVDTDIYKGVLSYDWKKRHFGNIIFELENDNSYNTIQTNYGTDDNFSIGLKALFMNKKRSPLRVNENVLDNENGYFIEANYKF